MPLKVNDKALDFSSRSTLVKIFSLNKITWDESLIVYIYPKDSSQRRIREVGIFGITIKT